MTTLLLPLSVLYFSSLSKIRTSLKRVVRAPALNLRRQVISPTTCLLTSHFSWTSAPDYFLSYVLHIQHTQYTHKIPSNNLASQFLELLPSYALVLHLPQLITLTATLWTLSVPNWSPKYRFCFMHLTGWPPPPIFTVPPLAPNASKPWIPPQVQHLYSALHLLHVLRPFLFSKIPRCIRNHSLTCTLDSSAP